MKYLLIIFLLSSACTSKLYNYPSLKGERIEDLEVQNGLSELTNQQIETGKLLLTIRAQKGDQIYAFRQALVFEKEAPLRLSLETYPVDAALLISKLVAFDKKFSFIDYENNDHESGVIDNQLIYRYYNLPLNHLELLNIVIGKLPESWLAEGNWTGESNLYSQLFVNNDKSRFVLVENGKLKKVLFFKPNTRELILSVDYTGKEQLLAYQDILGAVLPKNIELFIPEYDIKTQVDVRAILINQPIDQGIFQIMD